MIGVDEVINLVEDNNIINVDSLNMSKAIVNDKGPAPFIEVEDFSALDGIKHGFSTKLGGVSDSIFESMNLGFYVGDDKDNVLKNYERLGESIGIDYRRISCPNQVHNSNVLVVSEADAGDGITRELTHRDVDAQITNVPNLPLIAYSADCVPILLYDPVAKVIGSIHAGWRGTVAGIAAKTVRQMQTTFAVNPKNIHALIGPSISVENYEVDDTVVNAVDKCEYLQSDVSKRSGRDKQGEYVINIAGKEYVLYHPGNDIGKYMLDLWNVNTAILYNAGVMIDNIYNPRLCTMKYHDVFFSHRYTNGKRGLNAGIIMLDK